MCGWSSRAVARSNGVGYAGVQVASELGRTATRQEPDGPPVPPACQCQRPGWFPGSVMRRDGPPSRRALIRLTAVWGQERPLEVRMPSSFRTSAMNARSWRRWSPLPCWPPLAQVSHNGAMAEGGLTLLACGAGVVGDETDPEVVEAMSGNALSEVSGRIGQYGAPLTFGPPWNHQLAQRTGGWPNRQQERSASCAPPGHTIWRRTADALAAMATVRR